jgi:hypothetical protein
MDRCVVGRHRQNSIVPFGLPVFGSLGFNDTHESGWYDAPRKYRRIHQDEHVERIAIFGTRGRHETEVEGKHSSSRQYALQHERSEARFERELVRRTLRRFDDNQDTAVLEGFEAVE